MKLPIIKSGNNFIVKRTSLDGEISISGAKNSALKLLSASILFDKPCIISNYPKALLDIKVHEEMLQILGKKIAYSGQSEILLEGTITTNFLKWENRSIRNTLLILGCLLAKTGFGKVPLPGGCKLGERKYDIHVNLMNMFGADVWEEDNYLIAKIKTGTRLKGINFELPLRSTGATENGILMGVMAEGETRIWNPHIRPEVLDMIAFLNKAGAKIQVRGQESIIIQGVTSLNNDVFHSVIPDNMEALTYLIAGALAGDVLELKNFPFQHLEVPLIHLRESGLKCYKGENSIIVKKSDPYPIEISTGPYPGINSDMQPLFAVWGLLANGTSTITDLRFAGRYNYSKELAKMGGIFFEKDNTLKIKGGNPLKGSSVNALDLRTGAALVVAGLCANGETVIENSWMIERGYGA